MKIIYSLKKKWEFLVWLFTLEQSKENNSPKKLIEKQSGNKYDEAVWKVVSGDIITIKIEKPDSTYCELTNKDGYLRQNMKSNLGFSQVILDCKVVEIAIRTKG